VTCPGVGKVGRKSDEESPEEGEDRSEVGSAPATDSEQAWQGGDDDGAEDQRGQSRV
jgi:hypothetical protein